MKMRELIDLIEFDLLEAEIEAEIQNEKLGPVGKTMATIGALGSLATGALADEPADMDPGADMNQPVAQQAQAQKSIDLKDMGVKPEFFPTTKHFDVANKIVKAEYQEMQKEVDKLNSMKVKGADGRGKQIDIVSKAKADLRFTVDLMSKSHKIDRLIDTYGPDKAVRQVALKYNQEVVKNFAEYLKNVKQFEAPDSAERNVPQGS